MEEGSECMIYVPRICTMCGGKLRKLKTNRVLNIAGKGSISDVGLYFTDSLGEVVDVFGFYVCEQCGYMAIFKLEV